MVHSPQDAFLKIAKARTVVTAGTGAVIRVQAGDAGGGLEIALDWVFDCKYLYEHKEVIVSIPKQAFGELGPGFEGVTQGCFNMDT